jgi:hypothetical protein
MGEPSVYDLKLEIDELYRSLRGITTGDPEGFKIVQQIDALEEKIKTRRALVPFDATGRYGYL